MLIKKIRSLLIALFGNDSNFEVRELTNHSKSYRFLIVIAQRAIEESIKNQDELFSLIENLIKLNLQEINLDAKLEILFEVYSGF
ncbi:hypothetical protein SSABA_v1c02670 [Spiroplasma sabaudiense Ar-1343]|uniref:Uncharacterized protein n=1 Tax=Spiroplasma sabaudiense Ar-1343 TaxID=1276257 RepID=W6AIZ4_9MOLU|nr:hypothetical protein [Spiroplasma sabaudiense]AHI53679.1 hypothetical protein SSABA_v1c02670 [Spiroplasma sabaudiense Ar-1343]